MREAVEAAAAEVFIQVGCTLGNSRRDPQSAIEIAQQMVSLMTNGQPHKALAT